MREGLKNGEITVAGDQWPLLVYADCAYDPEEPWEGLFRNKLLVWVRPWPLTSKYSQLTNLQLTGIQAYIYFPELGWPGSQGNKVWERSHSRYDTGNDRVTCVCCHASTSLEPGNDCSLNCNLPASIRSIICVGVLSIRHFNGLWKILCHCIGIFRRSGRKGRSRWPP